MKQYFEIGRILKPQGLKGEVKVSLFTDDASRIDSLDYVFLKEADDYSRVNVISARQDGKGNTYIKLDGFVDRNGAEFLRGKFFYIDREHAASIPEGSFYIEDLIGLTVLDSKGVKLGILSDIRQNGCTDVYCVKADNPFMFPGIKDVFVSREPEKGIIVLDEGRLKEIAIYDF